MSEKYLFRFLKMLPEGLAAFKEWYEQNASDCPELELEFVDESSEEQTKRTAKVTVQTEEAAQNFIDLLSKTCDGTGLKFNSSGQTFTLTIADPSLDILPNAPARALLHAHFGVPEVQPSKPIAKPLTFRDDWDKTAYWQGLGTRIIHCLKLGRN